jgi:hypothetical protein
MTMKKTIFLIALILMIPGLAFATTPGTWGTPTYSVVAQGSPFKTWSVTFTGTSDNATIVDYATTAKDQTFMKGYYIYYVETDPGTNSPTAAYDIVINNAAGRDIMGGALGDRSATATESVFATNAASIRHSPPIDGQLTIVTTNNSANSATYTIKFYLFR